MGERAGDGRGRGRTRDKEPRDSPLDDARFLPEKWRQQEGVRVGMEDEDIHKKTAVD